MLIDDLSFLCRLAMARSAHTCRPAAEAAHRLPGRVQACRRQV